MPSSTPAVVAVDIFEDAAPRRVSTGDGLLLRPWGCGESPAVYEAYSDPQIRRWHARTISSLDGAREWIVQWNDEWHKRIHANWAVCDMQTGDLAGRISLKGIHLPGGQAEVAYWTMPAARGRAVA